MAALLDKVRQVVYVADKAVFLWEPVAGGLGLAVAGTRASRGRGGRGTDKPLYVNGALEARNRHTWARASR